MDAHRMTEDSGSLATTHRMNRSPWISCLALLGALLPVAPVYAQSSFTVDDAIDLSQVTGATIAPDGDRVLFLRRDLDWDENERTTRIWIVNRDGTGARIFTGQEGDASPAWSPDGRWVSFVRRVGDSEERPQIFLLPTDGGEALQLTKHPTGVQRPTWSADGSRILFVADDSLATQLAAERKKGADAIFVDEGPNGQTRSEWNAVWSVDAKPGEEPADAVRHTPEQRRIASFALSPDGRQLAYAYRGEGRRNDQHLTEIAILDVRSGSTRTVTENEAPESNLNWSPDGQTLSFVAPDLETWELDQGNLYGLDVASGAVRRLIPEMTPDMRSYVWHPDGAAIDFMALDRTDAQFYRLDLASGQVDTLTNFQGEASSPTWSADRSTVAWVRSSPQVPSDLFAADLGGDAETRLTDVNPSMQGRTLAQPEVVRWQSEDGLEIEGLLYRAGTAGATPLVLEIHGGPAGVFSRRFDADAQLLVAQGYAVLQPNVRGSSGYGDALLRGNMRDIGGGDYEDLMTGVDRLVEDGVAHPDSLAVKGWSYGGILGGWTLTQTDRFRAASLGAMVADWRSEFGAGFNFDVVRWYLGGDPWSNPETWVERSAYSHLDQVETPTILFHGANDRTDTMEQSMNFFAGLKHLGVDARLLVFPREGHGISEPRHRRTLLVEEMRWFQQYVRGIPDWEAPERPSKETVAPVSDGADGPS